MPGQPIPFKEFCQATPVIPAIRKVEFLDQAIAAHGKIVFLKTASP